MTTTTTGASLRRTKPLHANTSHHKPAGMLAEPYDFLTARVLRGLVAAMVD